jgi:[ribosomal protein S5]-alanine N-acetyltransferase
VSEILTHRLILRRVREADVGALHAHWTEPEVLRFLWDGRAIPLEDVREVVRASEALFRDVGAGLWSVRLRDASGDRHDPSSSSGPALREDGGAPSALIGCAGFWRFHQPPELELLISLSPGGWGRGLASEACRALIDFAFAKLGWNRVQASADSPNARSLALMRRLGLRPSGTRPGEFGAIEVFSVEAGEWKGADRPSRGSTRRRG